MNNIDKPNSNDNRNYNYQNFTHSERNEYPIIVNMISDKAKVIDLGCGNGTLLEKLIKEKNTSAQGIEISKSGIEICKQKALNVIDAKIDSPLPFHDNSFDYAICNVTIQMLMYPEILVKEMKRIAKYQIISFPNFAYFRNRIDMILNGRMPQKMLFGYKWHSTGHIHQLSVSDFLQIIKDTRGLKLIKRVDAHGNNTLTVALKSLFPNLFLFIPVYLFEKIDD